MVVVLSGSGCGFAEKRRLAGRIDGAPERLARGGPVELTVVQSLKVLERPTDARTLGSRNRDAGDPDAGGAGPGGGGLPPGLAGAAAGPTPSFTFRGSLDLGADAAALAAATPDGGAVPFQAFRGFSLFQHRFDDGGAPVTTGRAWAKLDLLRLADSDTRRDPDGVGANVLSPMLLVRLLDGTLEGSVREKGTDDFEGTPVRRYELNVDTEKAFKDEPEAQVDALRTALELMGMFRGGAATVPSVIVKTNAWLDDQDNLRRVEYRFRQRRARNDAVELTVRLDLRNGDPAPPPAVPGPAEVAEVDGIVSLANAAGPFAGAAFSTGGANG